MKPKDEDHPMDHDTFHAMSYTSSVPYKIFEVDHPNLNTYT